MSGVRCQRCDALAAFDCCHCLQPVCEGCARDAGAWQVRCDACPDRRGLLAGGSWPVREYDELDLHRPATEVRQSWRG